MQSLRFTLFSHGPVTNIRYVHIYVRMLAHLRDVVEYGECETGEYEPEKEKEPDNCLVHVAVLHVARRVARDVVAQPDCGDRDEHKVSRIEEGPGRVNGW